jgi:hypothetical protein
MLDVDTYLLYVVPNLEILLEKEEFEMRPVSEIHTIGNITDKEYNCRYYPRRIVWMI